MGRTIQFQDLLNKLSDFLRRFRDLVDDPLFEQMVQPEVDKGAGQVPGGFVCVVQREDLGIGFPDIFNDLIHDSGTGVALECSPDNICVGVEKFAGLFNEDLDLLLRGRLLGKAVDLFRVIPDDLFPDVQRCIVMPIKGGAIDGSLPAELADRDLAQLFLCE